MLKNIDFSNIKKWADLYLILSSNNNLSDSGLDFEKFTKLYFQFEPIVKDDYKNVWLHSEIPLEIKTKLNLVSVDHGIDLLLETVSNEYVAVQCKFRIAEEDKGSNLSWSKDKIANLFAYGDRCDKFIVFSNASKLDNVSTNRKENFEFINLDDLLQIKEETFKNISEYLKTGNIKEITKSKPHNHQQEAITKVVTHFEHENRGQLILPCGAGKTLTALWIKEKLNSKNTLVLVPSLALLKQIKKEWNEQKNHFYKYLCVCSEKDIDSDKYDSPVTHTYEIGATTDKDKIKQFLTSDDTQKVIFSTYQSLSKIKESLLDIDFSFDLAVCDEAHKTAGGKTNNTFGLIHSDENILVKKRLYMTATPRVLSEKLKEDDGSDTEDLLYDMSNQKVFGQEASRMSFKKAIDLKILVDYKILGIGVSDQELANYIEQRRFVKTDSETIEDYANNYALELVMKKYNASHAISFHSRVEFAEKFSRRHENLFDDIYCRSVSGSQTTTDRSDILKEFEKKEKGLVSNARCLTEGVDVPVIDLVYFADPKNSKIDIVQAAGRALRIDKHGNKKLGYIVVPIFHHKNKDINKAIDDGVFKNLVNVIRSLCDQDERLQDEINKLAFQKGKITALGERLEVVFEEASERVVDLVGFEEKLKNSLFDQVIEKASNNWGVKFENLKLWREVYASEKPYKWPGQVRWDRGNLKTKENEEEHSLGVWLKNEVRSKYKNGILDKN
jgi:predicted helicase